MIRFWAAFLSRVALGWIFIGSGYGKLGHLENTIQYFMSLGVPHPSLMAPFVAWIELFCGLFIVLGFFTRISCFMLISIMAVAIYSAKWNEIGSVSEFFGLSEFLYIVILLWIWSSKDQAVFYRYVKQWKITKT